MIENRFRFTDDRLSKLKPPTGQKRSYYYDLIVPGLRLQVTPSGTKSFQFQTWSKEFLRPVTLSLGKYPNLSILEARKKATKSLNEVNEGIDIEKEVQARKEEYTFGEMFEEWLEKFAKTDKRTWSEDVRQYTLYLEKPFGGKKISWFSDDKIRKFYNGMRSRDKIRGDGKLSPATANRLLALISTVFNKIAPDGIKNPCSGIKKFREIPRDRFLEPEEMGRFLSALEDTTTPVELRDYILLSLYTGGRRANILSMQWKEISFDRKIWKIPASKSKNKELMTVPLVESAIAILARRKKLTTSIFVFPGVGKTGHLVEPKKAWNALKKRAGIQDIRLHDLRRTMGSYQTMQGASTAIVGKTLGHRSPEATAIYARMNLDPVRAYMERAVAAMHATKDFDDKI